MDLFNGEIYDAEGNSGASSDMEDDSSDSSAIFCNHSNFSNWCLFMWCIDVEPTTGLLSKLLRIPKRILPAVITANYLLKVQPINNNAEHFLLGTDL